jgi:hypothetical protein
VLEPALRGQGLGGRDRDDWGPTITFQHYALEL